MLLYPVVPFALGLTKVRSDALVYRDKAERHNPLVIARIYENRLTNRAEIGLTFKRVRLFPRFAERRQQYANQYCDNPNHHQQFNEREPLVRRLAGADSSLNDEWSVFEPAIVFSSRT